MTQDAGSIFMDRYYGQLVGATILSFEGCLQDEDDYGDGFPTFRVKLADGEIIEMEVSQDPEGNGGGFLFGLASPDMSDVKE